MNRQIWKSLGRQLILGTAALFILCLLYIISRGGRFTSYITPYPGSDMNKEEISSLQVNWTGEDVLRLGEVIPLDNCLELRLQALKKGQAHLEVYTADGEFVCWSYYSVGPFLSVYDWFSGDFTGSDVILSAITAAFLLASVLMLRAFLSVRGSAFYSYETIYYAGFSLFAAFIGAALLIVTFRQITDKVYYDMYKVYEAIRNMSSYFIMGTTPFIVVFSVAMCASNIALLRHEKPRFQNILGILLSFFMAAGAAVIWLTVKRGFYILGPWRKFVAVYALRSVYATTYVYFECILIGAIACGIMAARHNPDPDKDYCIILGCWFRKDGTLPPLLRGRVDRAIRFAAAQKAKTGRELVFVPSGGQGKDEVMPEAAAMGRYLREQGIPDHLIMEEDQSRNTYENMANSKRLIDERTKDAKILYATTNYHVFRSGVWASLAGLDAEGIGGPTKWWFWPNAFVRECVGLLANRWKQELAALLIMIGFFILLNRIIP